MPSPHIHYGILQPTSQAVSSGVMKGASKVKNQCGDRQRDIRFRRMEITFEAMPPGAQPTGSRRPRPRRERGGCMAQDPADEGA